MDYIVEDVVPEENTYRSGMSTFQETIALLERYGVMYSNL